MNIDALEKDISRICLDTEGQARLEFGPNKYLFSFESALKSDINTWLIAAQIPLQGEELLGIDFQDGKSAKIVGNFLNKMRSQAKRLEKNGQISFNEYTQGFNKLGQILFFLDSVKNKNGNIKKLCTKISSNKNQQQFSCQISTDIFERVEIVESNDSLLIKQNLSPNKSLEFIFSSIEKDIYEKIQISFIGQSRKFEMIFFVSACTQDQRSEP